MADAGTKVFTPALVKVTTAGTAVALTALPATVGENFAAKSVIVQALSTNEEPVVVGDKNVVAKAGTHASPEQRGIELAAKQSISIDVIDPSQIYVDSRKNGDGVSYLVLFA